MQMSLEKFLHFLMAHNATIIEVLLGLTLLVILFLSIRIFLVAREPDSASGSSTDLTQIEASLKQILEKAGQVPVASAGSSEESQRLTTEISNLKIELESRQKQIEDMKIAAASQPSAEPSGLSNEEKAKLEAQIRELQAKLSEYEIISEDIADLSFYKEQNIKLQKELEGLKGNREPAAAAPPPASAPVASTPSPPAAPIVEPVAPKPEPEIVGRSKAAEAPAAPEAVSTAVDDDLMAEFAAAVEKQKGGGEPEAPAEEAAVDLGQMDMDKMLAEAATIPTADVPEVDAEKALGTGVDENKILQEAAALGGVTAEDKKLMGDFENFVKKSES